MLKIEVPGRQVLQLEHLVLDVNGTLTLDGRLLDGVRERIEVLNPALQVILLSAETRGGLAAIAEQLGLSSIRLQPDWSEGRRKAAYVRELGQRSVAAVGNGAGDADMLKEAALAVAVVGPEGRAWSALRHAHVLVTSATDALDLLVHPGRLAMTLRR